MSDYKPVWARKSYVAAQILNRLFVGSQNREIIKSIRGAFILKYNLFCQRSVVLIILLEYLIKFCFHQQIHGSAAGHCCMVTAMVTSIARIFFFQYTLFLK